MNGTQRTEASGLCLCIPLEERKPPPELPFFFFFFVEKNTCGSTCCSLSVILSACNRHRKANYSCAALSGSGSHDKLKPEHTFQGTEWLG
ncbi:hypothetical protein C6I21_15365 [Alkalicoccus urumqiensis]|uniref:Uncharacterized protein n=1 Tax=Alkalicoccus urumqiensis TaxID=1548213 RepID=A0A2P6MDG1_ALKUR|nr:hypothetical protein C6I21_15365 [Alkalicoccus urumqiensis]